MFTLSNVTFEAGGQQILQPASLVFPEEKVTTLLGHNGSGKSTLMKLLSRQQLPCSGEILLADQPLNALDIKTFALQVAYLPQQPLTPDGVTVEELVSFGRYPWRGALGRYNDEDRTLVARAIDLVGLNSYTKRLVGTLSGGERQRAWVAMLLAQNSRCILLDEPTSALDIAHQYELLSLIRRLNKELKLTVIMVLHDINMAARFSDYLIALHSGRVMAQGSPTEFMRAEMLEAIYGIPMGLFTHPEDDSVISFIR
ncbi:ATP-binding cassette domain-containing protein [Endozoicomonas sp. SM1973]|uniref:ATP-binding cassette domain-containing protein n=1 Tax=Spartinivicinus marinus TaxID=2994442 RepID=A0A853I6X7_9GAMM|nr:ATP-binding cassette domain-containing protein [Spartinivicinus marinus]MCX4028346.1 ATP-binding cassette domain-containing protein [Spartinivicinus marinus]NYZ65681.1 ATP-binding cassette domain-containing protein [Spartinivicinus marinus]